MPDSAIVKVLSIVIITDFTKKGKRGHQKELEKMNIYYTALFKRGANGKLFGVPNRKSPHSMLSVIS